MTKNSPTRAHESLISIIGHITIEELRSKLDEVSMASGLANRFLFACVKRSKMLPHGGKVPERSQQLLQHRTRQALTSAGLTTQVEMTSAASVRWAEEYTRLTQARGGLLGHITARSEPQVIRLALLYTLLDQAKAIDVPHLEAALELWRYCEASALHIFGESTGEPLADAILRELRRAAPDGIGKREIFDLFGRNERAAKLDAALTKLRLAGKAHCRIEKPAKGAIGGRPRELWFAC
jgi:hypothetical protein